MNADKPAERKNLPSVLSPEVQEVCGLVQVFIQSGLFPDTQHVSQGVVKILAGKELGIPAFTAMRDIHIISGKMALAAGLVASIIKASGKYDYRVVKLEVDICELDFYESGKLIGSSKFTVDDAKNAGLIRPGGMYQKYGRNMMFSRALTNGARWYCPDVFGGAVYTPDELDKKQEPAEVPSAVTVVPVNELGHEISAEDQEEMRQEIHAAVKQGVSKVKLKEQLGHD